MTTATRLALHIVAWSTLLITCLLAWRFGAIDAFIAAAISFCA